MIETVTTEAPVVYHPRANTIVAPGGSVTVVPAVTATATNSARNVRPGYHHIGKYEARILPYFQRQLQSAQRALRSLLLPYQHLA